MGLGLSIKWVGVAEFFDPTIAPQNSAVRLLERRGGFWCPQAFIMACQVLSFISARAFSLVQGTFLLLWYTERALIKFWRLCAPHIQQCDGNLMVGISLTLWTGKPAQLFLTLQSAPSLNSGGFVLLMFNGVINLTMGISLTLWARKPARLFLIGGINTHLNRFASLLLHSRVLAHISLVRSNLQPNSRLFSA